MVTKEEYKIIRSMEKKQYTIVTVANKIPQEAYYTFHEFFKSIGDDEVVVLGTHAGEYGGLGSKPRLLYHAIKNTDIKTKYLIFCDCFDVVFSVEPRTLFYQFLANFDAPLVISAEKNCFPHDLKEDYDKLYDGKSPYKYLNSGMIVGEVSAMLAVLEAMDAPNIPNDYWDDEKKCMINPNDQFYYQQIFLQQPVKIELDREQILCNTLHQTELGELDFDNWRVKNKLTGEYPCSFHFNGAAKTNGLREPILQHLNLI